MQFDRYLMAQLLRTTSAVAITLIGIMWLYQTISVLELVVNRGAPLTDFLVMSVTTIPLWLTIALPISALFAVIWVFHRTMADRELIVMQASGKSAAQLARAPVVLGVLITLFLSLNSVILLPLSYGIFKETQFRLRTSIPAVLLQDNVFIDVVDGMTMLIGEKDKDNFAKDIFIHDERNKNRIITMTASYGRFVEKDGTPTVVLQNGQRIELNENGEAGATLSFDTHTVSIVPIERRRAFRNAIDSNQDSIRNLLDPSKSPEPRFYNQRRAEGHYRIVSPLMALALVLLATCGVLFGQVRQDTWARRTTASIAGAVLLISLVISSRALAISAPASVPLLYASLLVPCLGLGSMLVWSSLAPGTRATGGAPGAQGGPGRASRLGTAERTS